MRLYDRLFRDAAPDAGESGFLANLNPDSLEIVSGCKVEPGLAAATTEDHFQFEREGYFCRDPRAGSATALVFNRTISLRDSWADGGK